MKRLMILVLCVVVCFGMLIGCGKKDVTAQSLMKGIDLTDDFSCEIGFGLEMTMLGIPIDMSADIDAEMAGGTVHAAGTIETTVVNIFEGEGAEPETETSEFDLYAAREGESYVTYVDQGDGWNKSVEETPADITKLFTGSNDYSGYTMTKEGNKYIVTGELKPEQILESIGDYANDLEGSGIDTEALKDMDNVKIVYTFNGSTEKLEAIDIDLSESLSKLFSQAATDSSTELGLGGEDMGLDMSGLFGITKLEVHVSNISFEKIGEIQIPEEALNA